MLVLRHHGFYPFVFFDLFLKVFVEDGNGRHLYVDAARDEFKILGEGLEQGYELEAHVVVEKRVVKGIRIDEVGEKHVVHDYDTVIAGDAPIFAAEGRLETADGGVVFGGVGEGLQVQLVVVSAGDDHVGLLGSSRAGSMTLDWWFQTRQG